MPRHLSEIEKKYIQEHYLDQEAEEIAVQIKGVGPITVQQFIDTLPPRPEPNETPDERHRKLQGSTIPSSRLMGRDPARGIAVMTEAASELSDARDVVGVPGISKERREKMKDKIHRPFAPSPHDR